jgi:hypothetical protein
MTYDPYQYPPHQPDPYQYPPQADPYEPPVPPYSPPPAQAYHPPPVQAYNPPGSMMPVPQPYMPPHPPPYGYAVPLVVAMPGRPSSAVAVWALVMGLVGIVTGWCLLGLPCIAAVILGHVALADTKSGEKSGRGQAIAGLALGYIALAPAIILFFLAVLGGMVESGT